VGLGWVHKIICAYTNLSLSFTFFVGSLRVVIVAALLRGLVEVCASATGNISGVVSQWHLFPYLTFFANFSSFPFLGWCFSVHTFHQWHHASNSATTITFIINTASMLHRPSPLMRACMHYCVILLDQAHMGFFHYYQLFC